MKKNLFKYLLISFLFLGISSVDAASLSLSSQKTQYNVDDVFDVYVNLNTDNQFVNSGEANMSFDKDILSVVSVNNSASIFSMWPEKPSFSNVNGNIAFNGGLPNPGFSGSKGQIVKITFKAKKGGSADIIIGGGSVYLNDGSGTDVLTSKRGITIHVNEKIAVTETTNVLDLKNIKTQPATTTTNSNISNNVPGKNLPGLPDINIQDGPSVDEWINRNSFTVEWDIPRNVDAVQFSIDNKEDSIPNIIKIPPMNNTKLINVANGISNFHIRFRNSSGWGETLHKKIKVDAVIPNIIDIKTGVNNADMTYVLVNAEDVNSGINNIKVLINGNEYKVVKINTDLDYKIDLPLLKVGDNTIKVIVYDNAGNFSEKELSIKSGEPKKPQIHIDNTEMKIGSDNNIYIKSYPGININLFIKDESGKTVTENIQVGLDGIAKYSLDKINIPGKYNIQVGLNNDCDDICVLSETISVNVIEKKIIDLKSIPFDKIKSYSENSAIPWTIAVIFVILYIISLKKRGRNNMDIIQELNRAEIDVYKIFKVLKSDARKYKNVIKRNKIDLTDRDKDVVANLEQDLDEAENYFAKRIERIEKELDM